MASFDLPLTVNAADRDISLLLHVSTGTTLGRALPPLLAAAGLAPLTPLFWGLAPIDPSWVLGQGILLAGVCLSDTRQDCSPATATVMGLACISGPDAGLTLPLEAGDLVLGRGSDADFVIDDPQLSRHHALISVNSAGVGIKDLDSLNGLRRAGISHREVVGLEAGQMVEVGSSLLQIRLMCPPIAVLTEDGLGHLEVTRSARVIGGWKSPPLSDPGEPPTRIRKPLPVLAAMMAGLLGVGVAFITGYWMFLMLAALGPVMMIINAVSDRVGGRKSHRRASRRYEIDSAEYERALAAVCAADLADSWERYPDPATIVQYAERPSARLWERSRTGPEWLVLRIGIGDRPARIDATEPPLVGPAPAILNLSAAGVAGICGDGRALFRSLVAQAAVLHSPADLQIVVFSVEPDLLPCQSLPHGGQIDHRPGAVINSDTAAAEAVNRLQSSAGGAVLLVFDTAARWRRLSGVSTILAKCLDPKTSMWALCLESESRRLPNECSTVITVSAGGLALRVQASTGVLTGTAEGINPRRLRSVLKSLEPLTDRDITATALPSQLSLWDLGIEINGLETDHELVREGWRQPATHAILGSAGDTPILLDLDDDGPHFLIAGTTGSGKSELLQTLVATLALAAPPQLLSFLLMDYKGGAAFAEAAQLPHTTGLVTDLDPDSASRVLTSLRAELHSRERQLAALGLPDLVSLRRVDQNNCPPRLVIVVDEFAALATDLPDFMDGLVDIAQRGRSLGIHLILATQRPAGVISPAIKANITGRICLRVTDDHDSADVIDSPLAARLPRESPGRAYLRTSKGNITLFQTARVAGPFTSPNTYAVKVDRRLPNGLRHIEAAPRADTSAVLSGATVLQHLVRACRCAASDLPPIRRPWLPPLPRLLDSGGARAASGSTADRIERATAILGLIDLPALGRQDLLALPRGSMIFSGPAGSGRSAALLGVARTAAQEYPNGELVVIDPSGSLQELRSWPQCATYLDGQDPWLVTRLAERLSQELTGRGKEANDPKAEKIVVLIDGWETCVAGLDQLDFAVASGRFLEIAGRGAAAGILLATSADPRIQHTRVAAAFSFRLELGPPQIPGIPGSLRRRAGSGGTDSEPDGESSAWPPGRGRLPGGQVVQLVLESAKPLSGRPAVGTGPEQVGHLLVIRELPATVERAVLPASHPAALYWALGDDEARPISLDSTLTQSSLLVAGPRRSGVSTTLSMFLEAAVTAGVPVLQTVRAPSSLVRPGVVQVSIRNGPAELESTFARHEGPLLVIADEGHELQDTPFGAVLAKFVQWAGPGQNLILGLRADRLGRSYRGLIAELAALRRGVLLQPDGQDGTTFDLQLPRRRRPGPPGRGVFADCGLAIPIQVARPTH